eukprot:8783050-Prorocentrum_lima.AAC.1
MEASLLLLELHGRTLRRLTKALGTHVQGLAQAERQLRNHLDSKTRRRLVQLDYATALVRHVTEESCAAVSYTHLTLPTICSV